MAKRVFVSSAQKAAARAMLDRSAVTGRKVSDSVRKIAAAKLEPARCGTVQDRYRQAQHVRVERLPEHLLVE